MPTSSADWATWVGALGTLAAVWLAVWLYSRARRDAKADSLARRAVVHVVLREYVIGAGHFVKTSRERLRDESFSNIEPATRMVMLTMTDVDRLTDLQLRLFDFGEEGDAEIAAFIEACREYQQTHRKWQQHADNTSFWEVLDGMDEPVAVTAIGNALDRVAATVEPALKAIERFDARVRSQRR